MKVSKLIKKLEKLKAKYGNVEAVIDYDENGWYASEEVKPMVHREQDSEDILFINIKSSNEC